MTRTRTRLALVGIVLLVVASAAPPAADTASAAEHSFVVEQGDRCYEVSPLRGEEDVASFYDYRYPGNHDGAGRFTYSTFMPDHLTRDDGSRLFLYEGPDGVSLVMVHNERGGSGAGTAVTFEFSGLPASGHWAVQDDDYDDQDDRFSSGEIDWSFQGDRTDGAAFLGLDRADTAVTVDPAFDEAAALYDSPVDREGNTESWEFLTGSLGSPDSVDLDRSSSVTVRTGHCEPDEQPPSAALTAEDGVAGVPVTFDATDSTDDRGIATYRWDFDGDGEPDDETTGPTVEYAFDEPGTYDASVTVVDEGGNTDTANASVAVEADEPPEAAFDVTGTPVEGYPTTFDARNASDDVGIAAYYWDFGGDGGIDRETTAPIVERGFEDAGSHEVTLTVEDAAGQNATATRTVRIDADDPPEPAFEVVSPEPPVEDEEVTFSANGSTDDTAIAAYRWSLGGNETATGERATTTYAEHGTYEVTLEAIDEGGNNATVSRDVEILPADETPPDAAVAANRTAVETGAPVGFDANESWDDRTIASYRWEFGDGATASGPTASHAYASAGTYDATVFVTDGGGNTDPANVTVEVFPTDETPPTAALEVDDDEFETGDEIEFDAGNSTDESAIVEYRWDFDGDGEVDRRTDDPATTTSYDSSGTYDATVTVADVGNNTDEANVTVDVERDRQAHSSGGGGGGGGTSLGPPPVVTSVEQRGPDGGLVDVRNARADETVESDLPATGAADETGVRFRELAVDLASDDPHFAVETSRDGDASAGTDSEVAESLPTDVVLGSLSVDPKYVERQAVEGVAYEVAIEQSRLDDAGLAPRDLRAFQRADGAWEPATASVVERGETIVLRVGTDGVAPVALGGDRPVTVANATLADGEVAAGEPVGATATLHNPGAEPRSFAVELAVDGEVVATETVDVPAGATTDATVETTLDPGTYDVAVAGADAGTATVVEAAPDLAVESVSVNESAVAPGRPVEIAAAVENAGTAAGERTVALTLFGEQVATETVEVAAGETERVTFVRAIDSPGTYTAAVGNETATLNVTAGGADAATTDDGPGGPGIPVPGFGIGAAVAALVAGLLVARRRL